MINELEKELSSLLVILVVTGPYLLLFYKKIGIRIRLLFISMAEIAILCTLIIIVFLGNGILVETVFFYNQFVWASVFLNIIIIFLSWLLKKNRAG
jgi:hypothetical protein